MYMKSYFVSDGLCFLVLMLHVTKVQGYSSYVVVMVRGSFLKSYGLPLLTPPVNGNGYFSGRAFPVQEYYLEDCIEMTSFTPPPSDKKRKRGGGGGNDDDDEAAMDVDGGDDDGAAEVGIAQVRVAGVALAPTAHRAPHP